MILGTAGHIDHGKTALVRALTGVDTDRLPEEKRRGITIELGFAPLFIEGMGTVGVVDVPGHEAFVRTMLAGAAGVDVALLVVAADEGVMPQTREHVAILELLGVTAGVVALTKCDLVDADWLELVTDDVRALLAHGALADAPVVATSVVQRTGLDELQRALTDAFRAAPARAGDDLLRLPLDRAFTVRGTGTVVTGTVWSGTLDRDAAVRILPTGAAARVRGLQAHGSAVERVGPGERVAVALAGVDLEDVSRGTSLVTDATWQATALLRADLTMLESGLVTLGPRSAVRLHLGTSEVGARVVATGGPVRPGQRRAVRVALETPIVARAGDRFVLRAGSPPVTVAGGTVSDPYPPRRARPWPFGGGAAERLRLMLEEGGAAGVSRPSLPVRLGLRTSELTKLLDAERPVVLEDRLYAPAMVERIKAELLAMIRRHHEEQPLEPGLPVQLARATLRATPQLVDHAVRELERAGELVVAGAVLAASGWTPTPSPAQQKLAAAVLEEVAVAGQEPPSTGELAQRHGAGVPSILRHLSRTGDLVQVEEDRFYAASALDAMVARLRAGLADGAARGPSEIREMLGLSRKYLIPFLEYCDRVGLTQRGGDGRVWRGG